ncbi:MAG: MFS transporter [Marinobacter sp.]|nr:MFS transporter [Marinobacter sp.]
MTSSARRPPAWLMVGTGILIVMTVLVFGRLAFGLILPSMRDGLLLSYQQAGNLGTATALGYLSLVLYAGIVASRRGGRFSVLLGITFSTVGFVGLSLVPGYLTALVLMTVLGFGTAFGFTPLISLLSAWFPEKRGSVIGFLVSGVGLGMLLAGWLVPFVVARVGVDGWRQVWQLFASAGVVAFIAALAFLRNPPQLPDAPGDAPMDRKRVYRNPHVVMVGMLYGVIGFIYIVQSVFMYSFAVEAGISAITAGQLTSAMGLLVAFSGPAWGWFGDRFGRGLALLISSSMAVIAMGLPVVWPALPSFVAHYLILGATMNGMFISILSISSERVSAREAPVAVSYVTVFFAVGQLVGPVGAGLLIDLSGFRGAFAMVCAVLVSGVFLSLKLHLYPKLTS